MVACQQQHLSRLHTQRAHCLQIVACHLALFFNVIHVTSVLKSDDNSFVRPDRLIMLEHDPFYH